MLENSIEHFCFAMFKAIKDRIKRQANNNISSEITRFWSIDFKCTFQCDFTNIHYFINTKINIQFPPDPSPTMEAKIQRCSSLLYKMM